jgi:PE family
MSGRGAEIRQPQIAMLAHADKRAAGPSLQDLFNDRAQPNNHLLRRTKEMSFVTTMSEAMTATAGGLQDVGSVVAATNAAAAAPTTGVTPAAADAVSALTAVQFATHAQMYQAISAQAAAIHAQFVATLGASAGSYAAAEAANAATLF